MIRIITSICVAIFLTGCMTLEEKKYETYLKEYNYLISQPVPDNWEIGAAWQFVLLNETEKIVESVTLEFTSEKAESCTSGDWKKVKIISRVPESKENGFFNPEPAYTLTGSYFVLDFNANICDAGNELRGGVTEQGISGERKTVHMFGGEKLGKFYGVKIVPNKALHLTNCK